MGEATKSSSASEKHEANQPVAMTLENAISNYHAVVSIEGSYWNFYSAVALGLLAFLGSLDDITRPAAVVTLIAFTIFWICNLSLIVLVHRHLAVIVKGIRTYLEKRPNEIPDEFREIVLGLNATPVQLMICFHIGVSVGLTILISIVCFK